MPISVYGVIMNLNLASGVSSHPGITITMMNKLSDAESAKSLPTALLPIMRRIFHSGIIEIMYVALFLMICAYVVNFIYNRHEAKKVAE